MRECSSVLRGAAALLLLVFSPAFAECADCGALAPYDCALSFLRQQDPGSAISILRQHLKQHPRDLRARNLLGTALTASHDLPAANLEFEKALRENPRFYPALENLAINELAAGEIPKAKTHFEKVLEFKPDDDLAHVYLGEIAFAAKECALSLRHYEKSRERVVSNPGLVLEYAQCALSQGGREAAVNMLEALPVSDAEDNFAAGILLGQARDYRDAAHYFERARQRYRDPYIAGYNQTLMELEAGDYPGAIRVANELFAQGYRKSDLYNLVAEAYRKNGQIKQAYDSLRTATEIAPDDEDNYVDLASLCLDHENYDLGIEIVGIGIGHIPNSERLYLWRGVIRRMRGQTKESEQDLLMACKLAPEKSLPFVALGVAWMQVGEFQKAIQMLREKARSGPTDFMIPYLYGEALVHSGAAPGSGEEQEALEAFLASVQLNPNYAHARAELGKLLLRRGKVDEAIVQLEKAAALDPKDTAPVSQLAQAYRLKGDSQRAQEMAARVSKLHAEEKTQFTPKDLVEIIREGTAGAPAPVKQ